MKANKVTAVKKTKKVASKAVSRKQVSVSSKTQQISRAVALRQDLQKSLLSATNSISTSIVDGIESAVTGVSDTLKANDITKAKISAKMKKQIAIAKKSLKKAQKDLGYGTKSAAIKTTKAQIKAVSAQLGLKKIDLKKSSTRKALGVVGLLMLIATGLMLGQGAMAAGNTSSLDSLGNQAQMMQKARPSVPANTYRVVQHRVIDRDFRSELGLNMGMVAGGGDSYYQTQNLGVQYDLHLNSRFSLGLRHQMNFNKLTPEGQRVYDRAEAMAAAQNTAYSVPDLDQPLSTTLATVSFYPIYGKVSWFESTVSYFDFYVMLGGGQTQLKSGSTGIATGGVGMGMWWNQHLSSRIEMRYQTYEDQIYTGTRKIEGAVASFTMGILL